MTTVPDSTTQRKPVVMFADFDGLHGKAIRDSQHAVWFRGDDDSLTLLHTVDIPALTLYGRVDLATEQAALDGPVYAWIERRNTEHARVAA